MIRLAITAGQESDRTMKKLVLALSMVGVFAAGPAVAADEYKKVPAGDKQYASCVSYAQKRYDGGAEASPIAGQTKVQAWCTCMWNETPEDFTGGLVSFSESSKGKQMNKLCETYSDWGG